MTKKDLRQKISKQLREMPTFREVVNDEYTKNDEILVLSLSNIKLVDIIRCLKGEAFNLNFHDMKAGQTYSLTELITKNNTKNLIKKLVLDELKNNTNKIQDLSKDTN
jgi:hypothetical protein